LATKKHAIIVISANPSAIRHKTALIKAIGIKIMNTTLKNHKPTKTLIKKKDKKRVILCNSVYLKSPKTSRQRWYSDQEFYPSDCVKMCNFGKKSLLKQPKASNQSAIQPVYSAKQQLQTKHKPKITSKNYTLLSEKNSKSLKI